MPAKTNQDNEYETETSNSDDEIDIDGKLKLDDSDEEGGCYDDDDDSDEEENDVTTFGQKRKKNSSHCQLPTKKSKKAERKSKEIFVKNLPLGCSEEDVRKDFADYNIIITKMKLKGRANGKTAHITTVKELSESDILSLDGMVVNECPVVIELAKDKSKIQQRKSKKFKKRSEQAHKSNRSDSVDADKKLFVKNLSWNVTEDVLREHFNCIEVNILKNADGTIRGFAYLTFSSEEDATKALDDLQDSNINGRIIKLDRVNFKGSGAKAQNNRNREAGSKRLLHNGRGLARSYRKLNSDRGKPKVGATN